jgi:flagellar basal body rod protein FlgG
MDVSGIGATQSAITTGAQSGFKQTAADFKLLAQALHSGDLAGAQQAFATLQQDSPRIGRAVSESATSTSANSGNAASSLQSLSKALQSGDLAGAQQAFAALQQALGGHHGHHHHASSAENGSTTLATTAASSPVNGAIGTNVNAVV